MYLTCPMDSCKYCKDSSNYLRYIYVWEDCRSIGRIFRGGCVQCIAVSVSMRSALGWSGGIKFEWSEVESDFPV